MPKKQIPEAFQGTDSNLPFSPVVQIGNHFHFSGTLPDLNSANRPDSDDLTEQTSQVMKKIKQLLKKCGLSLSDVYSVTILTSLSMMDAYSKINDVYVDAFKGVKIMPRRKAFSVYELPFGAKVEIEFDAVKQD